MLNTEGVGTFPYVATAAVPITIGEQLEEPDAQVTVLNDGGDEPDRILGTHPEIQVISRDLDHSVAFARAESVFLALHNHQGQLDGEVVGIILADTTIVPLGRDGTGRGTGRWEFSQTFRVTSRSAATKGQRA